MDQNNRIFGVLTIIPRLEDVDFIEFDSMINLRPSQGNLSRGVEDPSIQEIIVKIKNKWITRNK
ncbi:MAG: DUF5674 family protein [Candidatus Marinimicrobia bacterium]|jgi:hypothetical protein|nr:DUF5674 family protein [Candidatus Neomarinimicrobiota bacterium]|tara:strand:- start:185 stop:376 length:192 start_codon:yes stop_codon:yes gene_type:complete